MENVIVSDMKNYVKSYKKLILLSFITAVLCFGFLALSRNIRIDSEELINEPGSTLGWLTIGRYGLVVLKRILGLSTYQAMKSGLLFLVFFIIGENLLIFSFYHFSGKNEKLPYWAFLLLYGTSNIWCFQIYFSMQQAEVALAMLGMVVSALCSMEACFVATGYKRWVELMIGGAFLVLGLGTYQALAAYYIAICVAIFLVIMEREGRMRQRTLQGYLGRIVGLIAHFGVFYLVYNRIANTWFMATEEYMQDQRGWGKYSLLDCLKNVLRTIKNSLLSFGPRNFSFYSIGVLMAIFVFVLLWKGKRFDTKGKMGLYALALAGFMFSPFLMTLYMGEMLVTRSQFAMPVVAAFLGMYGVYHLAKQHRWAMYLSMAAVLLVTLGQVSYDLRLVYTDDYRYAQDAVLAEQILDAMTEANQGEIPMQPVVFVGYQKPEYDGVCARTEMYGWSFFEWDYAVENPTGATHRIVGFIQADTGVKLQEAQTEEIRDKAVELAEQMHTFPAEEAIVVTDELVVVKLSEITERTDINWW